jgi:hypothetical protein
VVLSLYFKKDVKMYKIKQISLKKVMVIVLLLLINNIAIADTNDCSRLTIPIVFDEDGLPYLEVKIQNKSQLALFDLGAEDGIHIPKKILHEFKKLEYTGKINKSSNITGNIVSSKEFIIPSLRVNCLLFNNVTGMELSPWAASIGEKSEVNSNHNSEEQKIIIGRGLFKNTSIVIDYKNEKLIVKKHITDKKVKEGLPFYIKKEGIVIAAKTSIETYKMVVDTGSSSSIIVLDKVPSNESTKECEYDLGEDLKCNVLNAALIIGDNSFNSNILLYPIDSRFKMDGILGSDFLNAFLLELNFITQHYILVEN